MKITILKEPFYHTIIEDYYDEQEQSLIWQELDFLNQPGKLLGREMTGDPLASENKKGIFLDVLYGVNRQVSNILTVNRKLFNVLNDSKNDIKNPFHNFVLNCNRDMTLVSYYSDGCFYGTHKDLNTMTAVTTFWEEPKQFSGGQLVFTDYDYEPKMNHNTLILFPSFERHCVTEVKNENENGKNSRYTINQFFTIVSSVD
jgi:hypothetical protein